VVTKGIKQQQSLVVRNFAVNCNTDAISKTEHLNEVAYIGEWISRTYEPWCPPEMDPPWPLMAAAGPTKEHELLAARLRQGSSPVATSSVRESRKGLVLDHDGGGTDAQHWRGGVFLAQYSRTSPAAAP